MKKIFYLFIISLFLIPSIVNAANTTFYTFTASGGIVGWKNASNTENKYVSLKERNSDWYYSAADIAALSGPVTAFFGDVSVPSDISEYRYAIVSVSSPFSLVSYLSFNETQCLPYGSYTDKDNFFNNNVTSFLCDISSSKFDSTTSFTLMLSSNTSSDGQGYSFYIFRRITLIAKDSMNGDIQSALNHQTEEITNSINQTNQQIGDLNNNITNADTSDANSSANEFFSGFESNDFGLSSIITAPLNLIKSITSSTCTPIGFKAPFVNQQITLPCMRQIYEQHFGSFLTIYQTITFGLIAYWVCVNIFAMVKGFKDPDSDRIEVLDL